MRVRTNLLTEEQFFRFHDDVKANGGHILRCQQIDGRGPRVYVLIWME